MRVFAITFTLLVASNSFAEDTIKVGTLSALTGYSAKQGVPCKNAFEIALKSWKGKREVELVVGDSQRKAGPSVSEFTRMISSKGVSGVVLCGSPVGMGVNPISKREGIPIIGAVGHKDFLPDNENAFAIWPSTTAEGAAVAEKVLADKKRRVAIVSAEDDWTLSLRDGFAEKLKEAGAQVVVNEEIPREETDFNSLVLRLRSKKPDAIFVNLVLGNSGVFARKVREMGIDATLYANYFAATEAEMKTAGDAAEGVIATKMAYDRKAITNAYKKFGYGDVDPNAIAFTCMGSMSLLLSALNSNPTLSSPKELKDALLKVKEFEVLPGETLKMKNRRAEFRFQYEVYQGGIWKKL